MKATVSSCGQTAEKVSVLAELGHNFKHYQIGSRRASIYLQMFAFSATHWLNMVSDFGCFSRFWASLVVVALVGMSEKGKMFGFHCFFLPISGLVTSFVIVAAAHLGF